MREKEMIQRARRERLERAVAEYLLNAEIERRRRLFTEQWYEYLYAFCNEYDDGDEIDPQKLYEKIE